MTEKVRLDEQPIAADYTDGRWVATTMGQFIQIMIDSGHDPCVIFRVEEDRRVDNDSSFIRKMTVFSFPNGWVVPMCYELGIVDSDRHSVYKVLKAMIEKGLVT